MDRKINACSQTALIEYPKVFIFHQFLTGYMDMSFISVGARQMHCLPCYCYSVSEWVRKVLHIKHREVHRIGGSKTLKDIETT